LYIPKLRNLEEAGVSRSGNADQNAKREKGWEPSYLFLSRYRKRSQKTEGWAQDYVKSRTPNTHRQ